MYPVLCGHLPTPCVVQNQYQISLQSVESFGQTDEENVHSIMCSVNTLCSKSMSRDAPHFLYSLQQQKNVAMRTAGSKCPQ